MPRKKAAKKPQNEVHNAPQVNERPVMVRFQMTLVKEHYDLFLRLAKANGQQDIQSILRMSSADFLQRKGLIPGIF